MPQRRFICHDKGTVFFHPFLHIQKLVCGLTFSNTHLEWHNLFGKFTSLRNRQTNRLAILGEDYHCRIRSNLGYCRIAPFLSDLLFHWYDVDLGKCQCPGRTRYGDPQHGHPVWEIGVPPNQELQLDDK